MRFIVSAALLAAIATAPAVADDDIIALKPEQIGQIFCLSRIGSDEGAIAGLLSTELTTAIAYAWARDDSWTAANPGDKPPLGDGIPWQSWPDYASNCAIGLVTLMKTDAKVEINYGFPDQPDADFTDTLLLKRLQQPETGQAHWRIDNIAFATGNDLRTFLDTAFDDL